MFWIADRRNRFEIIEFMDYCCSTHNGFSASLVQEEKHRPLAERIIKKINSINPDEEPDASRYNALIHEMDAIPRV